MNLHFSTDLQNALEIIFTAEAYCGERNIQIDYALVVELDARTGQTGVKVTPADGGLPVAFLTGHENQYIVVTSEDGTFPEGATYAYEYSVIFKSSELAAEFLVGYLLGCRARTVEKSLGITG